MPNRLDADTSAGRKHFSTYNWPTGFAGVAATLQHAHQHALHRVCFCEYFSARNTSAGFTGTATLLADHLAGAQPNFKLGFELVEV